MLRPRNKTLATLLVAGAFIYLFVNKLDWARVWADVRHVQLGPLLLAAALLAGTYGLRSLRWRYLLAPMARPPLAGLFRATTLGFTALFIFGRAGEMIVRPAALSMKDRVNPSASYATVLIERVIDSVTVVVFFAINLAFFQLASKEPGALEHFRMIRITGITLLAVSAAGIYGLSVFRTKREGALRWIERRLCRLPGRISQVLMSLLSQISEGLAVLHDLKSLTATAACSALLWGMVAIAYVLVIRAFGVGNTQIPFTGAVFVMGMSMVGSVVPAPGGGAGPFHAATAASLVFLGVERNQAASAAIMLHLVIFTPALIFGALYLFREGLSLMAPAAVRSPSLSSRPDRALASPQAAPEASHEPLLSNARTGAKGRSSSRAAEDKPVSGLSQGTDVTLQPLRLTLQASEGKGSER